MKSDKIQRKYNKDFSFSLLHFELYVFSFPKRCLQRLVQLDF